MLLCCRNDLYKASLLCSWVTRLTHYCVLNCKLYILYFDSKFVCDLRLNCNSEARFSSLGIWLRDKVLQEKSCSIYSGERLIRSFGGIPRVADHLKLRGSR